MEDDNKKNYFGEGDIGKRSPLAEKPKSHADPTATASSNARSTLAQAEDSALSGGESSSAVTDQSGAQAAESQPSFASNVTGNKGKGAQKGQLKGGRGKFRRFGPLGALLAIILGGGGLMMGAQSLMPFGIANNLMENFNSMRTVMNRRGNAFMRFQMNPNRNVPIVRHGSIFRPDRFHITDRMATRMGRQELQFVTNTNGKRVGIIFDNNGVNNLVTIDGNLPTDGIFVPDGVSFTEVVSIDAASQNPNFTNKVDRGTRTWRGHVAGWFDRKVAFTLIRLGIGRNHYMNHSDPEIQAAANEAKRNRANLTDLDSMEQERVQDIDPETGEVIGESTIVVDSNEAVPGGTGNAAGRAKAEAIRRKAMAMYQSSMRKTADIISGAVQATCAVLAGLGVVLLAVAAYNAMQVLNYVSGMLESIQKTQAGHGDESPMTDYMNNLTMPGDTGRNAMQSAGMAALFGGTPISSGNESVESFNVESTLNGVLGALGASMASFAACAYARIAAATAGLVITIIKVLSGPGGWVAKLVGLAATAAMSAIAAVGFATLLGNIMERLIPALGREMIESAFGEDVGNAIMSGAHMYMGRNHQTGGASLGDMDTVLAFHRETQIIIAEEAELERRTRSPLDVTSPHTFLGSIMHSIIPVAATIRSPMSAINAASNTVNRSVLALMPTVSAVSDEARFVASLNTDCPFLGSLGAVGDAFCNPYFVSDLNTINIDPAIVMSRMSQSSFSGEEENGNPQIAPNSDLGRYIVSCGTRDSPFGAADANIAQRLNTVLEATNIGEGSLNLNTVIGAAPGLGNLQAAAAAVNDAANIDWISGQRCVANVPENPQWSQQIRYYQRFIEDQRLMEQQGLIDQSAVAVFLDWVEEVSPTDNSEAGILARFMGVTRGEAEEAIAKIEHIRFMDTYDPVAYGPLLEPVEVQLTDTFENINAEIAEHGQAGPIATITALGAMLRNRAVLV